MQENPVPFWGFPEPIKLLPTPPDAKAIERVSPDEAFKPADFPYEVDYGAAMGLYSKRKRESIHFIDAREPDLFAAGHIPGAVNIPYEFLGEHIKKLDAIPKNELIVIYCDGGDCHLSHDLAEMALSQGYRRLCVFVEGWEVWSAESDFIATDADTE